jgi:alpha-L-arabinofuranosidase
MAWSCKALFEVYSQTCGDTALDVHWAADTFSTPEFTALRRLDVSATLDTQNKKMTVYLVNRTENKESETTINLLTGQFAGNVKAYIVNGPDVKAENTFATPNKVGTREQNHTAKGTSFTVTLEPHSFTALVFDVA